MQTFISLETNTSASAIGFHGASSAILTPSRVFRAERDEYSTFRAGVKILTVAEKAFACEEVDQQGMFHNIRTWVTRFSTIA